MQGQTAVVLGATGLIGSQLIQQLLIGNTFTQIIVLTRRPFEHQHAKLINKIINFDNTAEIQNSFKSADVIFCAIGTTQQQVNNDEAAYRKIDYDIPVNTAKIAHEKGVKQYILVSSAGANVKASNFYLRLKGEVEEAISSTGFESVYLLRPSILLGRRNKPRMGESIGKVVMNLFSFLLAGSLRKFRPIQSSDVAQAMVAAAVDKKEGVNVLHYDEMVKISSGKEL